VAYQCYTAADGSSATAARGEGAEREVSGHTPHMLSYLSDHFQHVASYNRRHLRSSSKSLLIPRMPLIAVGDRAFPVAGSCLWNSLLHVVTSAPTRCFPESTQNLPVLSFVLALTDACIV